MSARRWVIIHLRKMNVGPFKEHITEKFLEKGREKTVDSKSKFILAKRYISNIMRR